MDLMSLKEPIETGYRINYVSKPAEPKFLSFFKMELE